MTATAAYAMTNRYARPRRHPALIFFDPGSTTGVIALTVRPGWLDGQGEPGWAGLGKAVSTRWFAQVGRLPRVRNVGDGSSGEVDEIKAATPRDGRAVRIARQGQPRIELPNIPGADEIDVVRQCEDLLDLWPDAAWGYEGFTPRLSVPAGTDYLSPVRVFSALAYVEVVHGERRVPFTQSASMAKTTATDARLRMAGLYAPGMPHATDAARHAATFLRSARLDPELRAMAWPKHFA